MIGSVDAYGTYEYYITYSQIQAATIDVIEDQLGEVFTEDIDEILKNNGIQGYPFSVTLIWNAN